MLFLGSYPFNMASMFALKCTWIIPRIFLPRFIVMWPYKQVQYSFVFPHNVRNRTCPERGRVSYFMSFMLFIHFRPISFFIFICFKSRQIYAFVLSLRRCNPRSTSTNRIFLKKSYGSWNDRRHASRVKNPATAMKGNEMDAIDKASWACQEIHDVLRQMN